MIMKKILILDDHGVILNLVGKYLEENLKAEVVKVKSIEEFNKINDNIDVYIIDLSLTNGSGFDVLDILSKKKEDKVIVYTSNTDSGIIRHLFNLNYVKGIVNKASDESELVNAVNAVATGSEYLCKKSSQILNNTTKSFYDLEDEIKELTTREREVLNLIWDNLSSNEISEKLFISVHTVEHHRRNIKKKLGADSIISIIKTSLNKGYINTLTN